MVNSTFDDFKEWDPLLAHFHPLLRGTWTRAPANTFPRTTFHRLGQENASFARELRELYLEQLSFAPWSPVRCPQLQGRPTEVTSPVHLGRGIRGFLEAAWLASASMS